MAPPGAYLLRGRDRAAAATAAAGAGRGGAPPASSRGLAVLVVDLYSGIGTQADVRLSAHMLEHMVMWVVVAPLLAAGAPIRLALFAFAAVVAGAGGLAALRPLAG